eukprot:CAMPEP_0175797494 /NCGR_PEP_ID=MMETSP0097-20121207/85498_1 /TAXON_ID=311494 /ORGANISM="Alexandrium monilatum, Strain CCMP3105" /LENGTH=46 /DNA_ID= /DNA_START= /DNA_END= /DNA_ORIENTATION=
MVQVEGPLARNESVLAPNALDAAAEAARRNRWCSWPSAGGESRRQE